MQSNMALLANGEEGIFLSALLLVADDLLAAQSKLLTALAQQLFGYSGSSDFLRTAIIHINGN